MKVLVAINGSIISESMALYALRYAKQLGYALELFHISNTKDDLLSVEKTFAHIQTLAKAQDVEFQTLLFDSPLNQELQVYVEKENVDIIFCSTRREESLFENSFSQELVKLDLDVDLAIVRIVKLVDISALSSIMLSIRKERLSVRKFTFFASLASAYEAQGQIYSVTPLSKSKFARLDMHKTRQKLHAINHQLRHYLKLSTFMPFELIIKHHFSDNEVHSILYNVVKSESDLVVVGAKRLLKTPLFFGQRPLEKLMEETSVNVIAFYTKED